jgi:predicted ATPase
VRFVPLAAARAADVLLPAIAAALGLSLSGAEGALEQLVRHLRGMEQLLVLDNLEQLRDGVAALAPLIERAPRLTLLATSRERLRLRGEWVLELGGLTTPADDAPESIDRSSAATLFMQVARRAGGHFAPDVAERRAITQICRALAGHPLGIELAASWAHVLSCAEIAAELARSLELLASDAPDQPERHRTIQAVFDASWHLLAEPERLAMRQLSAFRGGFDREAATACVQMSADHTRASPQFSILHLLSTLIGKSLLMRAPDGRYSMHELVRQYAGEQLRRAGEVEQTWARHGAYFISLVEQAEPHLKGADEAAWLDRLEAEHDNLRAALDRALAGGAVELAARICVVLRWLWYIRGYLAEGRQWIERALAASSASPAQLPPRLRARLLQGAGVLADEQADYAVAAARYEESIALYREIGDTKGIQATTNSLGMLAWARGDYAQAQSCFEESLRLSRQLGHIFGIANSLNSLGTTIQAQGGGARALALYEEALATAHTIQYDMLITMILDNIGELTLAQGDLARAHAVYVEALARQQSLGDTRGAALSRQGLGLVALAQGDLAAASLHLYEGLAASWQSASQRELAAYIDHIAALAAARGHAALAARLCGATAAFRERSGTPLTPFERPAYERTQAAARAGLDAAAFDAAWAAGRAAPLEQIIAELLE